MKKQILVLLSLYCLQTMCMDTPLRTLQSRSKRILEPDAPRTEERRIIRTYRTSPLEHNNVNEGASILPHLPNPRAFEDDTTDINVLLEDQHSKNTQSSEESSEEINNQEPPHEDFTDEFVFLNAPNRSPIKRLPVGFVFTGLSLEKK